MAPDLLKQIDLDYLAGNPSRQGGKNTRSG
jgi:hypothetical protein